MLIEITYNVTDVYMSTIETPVYVEISFEQPGGGAAVWGSITGTLSDQTDLQNALNAKVPYSGATQDVSLGEYGINLGNVIYDTTPTGIPTEQGATYWDADAETVALIMNGTIQKVGEDTFYHVRNTTGSTIAKGTAVRFSGTTGNSGRLLIAPMLADGTYPSQYYMGITSEEIANNQDGKVYHFGKMRNINTSAFSDGDVLYVSPSVAGALTSTAPVAPNNIIVAAAVVHAANNGTLMIRTTLGSNINADEGVLLTTPTANQGLFYDSGLWVNKSITTALGYTPVPTTRNITINGVTYDLSADRTWTIAAGISGTIATGQVAFGTAADTIGGSNNLLWDNTNSRLGIGTNAPATSIDVRVANSLVPSITLSKIIGGGQDGQYLIMSGGNGLDQVINAGYNLLLQSAGNTALLIARNTRNVSIGFTTDQAVRLAVSGDTLLRGSGNTSATTALTVQNSASSTMMSISNDAVNSILNVTGSTGGFIQLNQTTANRNIYLGTTGTTVEFGVGTAITNYRFTNGGGFGLLRINTNTLTTAGGNVLELPLLNTAFAPTSGSAALNLLLMQPNINQTGGANGITRGLYVNPTLTAAADFRAIETTAGNVLFGSNFFWDNAQGRLGIGTNVPSSILDIQPSTGSPTFRIARNSGADFRIGSSTLAIGALIGTYSAAPISLVANSATVGTITSGGNFILGVSTDNGQRLQVYGGTLLRGSGNTSATTALTVQNSDVANLLRVRNDGALLYGQSGAYISTIAAGTGSINSAGAGLGFLQNDGSSGGRSFLYSGASIVTTSGVRNNIQVLQTFAPTSGTAVFNNLALEQTINQQGGANGITRGLYVSPSLTAAADWRSIEWSNNSGWGLYGAGTANNYLAGNTQIGAGGLTGDALLVVRSTPSIAEGNLGITLKSATTGTPTQLSFATLGTYSAIESFQSSASFTSRPLALQTKGGDVIIGTNASLGVRFGVVGDTILRGSGATNATTALTVQNSSSTNLFSVRNDGFTTFGGDLLVVRSTGSPVKINVSDGSNTTTTEAYLQATAGTTQGYFLAWGQTKTLYKIFGAGDVSIYKSGTAGDIAILNDMSTGSIKMAAGGASTAHLTIKSNGRINMSSLPTSSTGLVAGDLWNDAGTVKIV